MLEKCAKHYLFFSREKEKQVIEGAERGKRPETAVKWPHVFHTLLFCPIKAAGQRTDRARRPEEGAKINIAGHLSFASFSFPEMMPLKVGLNEQRCCHSPK